MEVDGSEAVTTPGTSVPGCKGLKPPTLGKPHSGRMEARGRRSWPGAEWDVRRLPDTFGSGKELQSPSLEPEEEEEGRQEPAPRACHQFGPNCTTGRRGNWREFLLSP